MHLCSKCQTRWQVIYFLVFSRLWSVPLKIWLEFWSLTWLETSKISFPRKGDKVALGILKSNLTWNFQIFISEGGRGAKWHLCQFGVKCHILAVTFGQLLKCVSLGHSVLLSILFKFKKQSSRSRWLSGQHVHLLCGRSPNRIPATYICYIHSM